jgi:hypothetical protein
MESSAWQENDELLVVTDCLLCICCITHIRVLVFFPSTIRTVVRSTLVSTMFPSNIWCMLWNHRLLEILNENATLLTKAISTMFVPVVVGSLLLFSSLEISKTASRSIYRTKGKASETLDPETAE